MKKCPVCGVEHSDIVPVCSICGSSLANAEVLPDAKTPEEGTLAAPSASKSISDAKVTDTPEEIPASQEGSMHKADKADLAEAPAVEAKPLADVPVGDFSSDDIQAAVSSVVNFAVNQDKKHLDEAAEIDPFEEDSPFVENAMRERKSAKAPAAKEKADRPAKRKNAGTKGEKPVKGAAARRPAAKKPASARQPEPSKEQPTAPVIDTTAVAAASAQKVQAAKDNAVAARQRNPQPEEENPNSFDWSERKHKRNQPKTTTPVIAAVCALLVLLIVAMLFLLGRMLTGNDQQQGNQQPGVSDQANPGDDDQQTPDGNTDGTPDAQQPDDAVLPEEDPNAEDGGDTAGPENQDGQDGMTGQPEDGENDQPEDGQDSQQPEEGGGSQEETPAEKPALPEITEVNDTVYATAAVNVRDYPSTENGAVINGLSKGQAVTRTGKTATGWSRVKLGDTVGYVSNSYLSTSKVDTSDDGAEEENVAYATAGVNVRETPNGTVVGTLTKGQKVTLTGKKEGSWVQIKANGLTGYVYNSYLSATKDGGSDNKDGGGKKDDVKITETGDTVYATSGVNIRDYPNTTDGKVIGTLSKGQKVTRIGTTSNGWSKVKTGSLTGYVYSSYLSTSKDGGSDGDNGGSKRSGYILPDSATRNYSKDELSSLSSSKLRLARNEIYARHGRKFNDKSLQDYFNGCSWYSGTVDAATFDANINSYLNSYELANLQLIKELEG